MMCFLEVPIMTGRLFLFAAAVAALAVVGAGPAKADSSSNGPQQHWTSNHATSSSRSDGRNNAPMYFRRPSNSNAVFLGGTPIIRVRVGANGYTPDQRATLIQERLNRFLGQGPITPEEITTEQVGDDAVVLIKGQLMFTADSATASYNSSTPIALANHWADHLRAVLPELTAAK
jgi:hypothetical protein